MKKLFAIFIFLTPIFTLSQTTGGTQVLKVSDTAVANGMKRNVFKIDSTTQRKVVSIDNLPSNQIVTGTVNIGNTPTVNIGTTGTIPVSGSFWQTTQPVSLTSLPTLPTGTNTIGNVNVNGTIPVSGTFWQATQPISGTVTANAGTGTYQTNITNSSLPVTQSGTWNMNVVGGNATAVKVDGSAVTQPVSGSVSISGTPNVYVSNFPASQPVTGTFWQSTQPVSLTSIPLPTNAATESGNLATIAANTGLIEAGIPASLGQKTAANSMPVVFPSDMSLTVNDTTLRNTVKKNTFRTTFAQTIASGVDANFFNVVQTGTGQVVSQSSGNLVFTSGTTVNAETFLRSTQSFTGSHILRELTILSQRIANNNFYVELADVIGDGLAVTVNSATSITVTIPNNPFTSVNVGQFINIDNVQNISASAIPGRYAIASVSGNNVNFTVAAWPASGSGTCTLSGWNYHQIVYTGTTATNVSYDAQRRGWNSGATTATINTTASPGQMGIMMFDYDNAYLADQLVATNAAQQITVRASRVQNLPDENTPLFIQLKCINGSTAPASNTTWTVGMLSCENYAALPIDINNVKPQGVGNSIPVTVNNTPSVTVSSGTITTVSSVTSATPATGTNYNVVTTASTNAASIKASAGTLFEITASNVTATATYVKLYNKASAPTVGTDVPILTIPVPANTTISMQFGTVGKRFATGIAVAVTGAIGATDATNAVAGVQVNGTYL